MHLAAGSIFRLAEVIYTGCFVSAAMVFSSISIDLRAMELVTCTRLRDRRILAKHLMHRKIALMLDAIFWWKNLQSVCMKYRRHTRALERKIDLRKMQLVSERSSGRVCAERKLLKIAGERLAKRMVRHCLQKAFCILWSDSTLL